MMTLTLTATTPPAPGCQSVFAINLDIPGSLAVRRRRRYVVLRLRVPVLSLRGVVNESAKVTRTRVSLTTTVCQKLPAPWRVPPGQTPGSKADNFAREHEHEY